MRLRSEYNIRTARLRGLGQANDNTVLRRAVENGLTIPPTHYYLADGGYSKKNRLVLVPFQRTRYHLREIGAVQRRPQTKEELFNLRHSSLRNVIERLNGVLKKRWRVLRDGPEEGVSVAKHSLLVYAISAVHDFINQHGQSEAEDASILASLSEQSEIDAANTGDEYDHDTAAGGVEDGSLDNNAMVRFRDALALRMWQDYRNNK